MAGDDVEMCREASWIATTRVKAQCPPRLAIGVRFDDRVTYNLAQYSDGCVYGVNAVHGLAVVGHRMDGLGL